ncbi:hypothetical protein ACFL37_01250 [Candidatus Margulisiibacteriota bacterium]
MKITGSRPHKYASHRTRCDWLISTAHHNPWTKVRDVRDEFLHLPAAMRKQAILQLVSEGNALGERLVLQSDGHFLRGFSAQEKKDMWAQMLSSCELNYLGQYLVPTRPKMDELLAAVMETPQVFLHHPRVEYLAHLASYFKWSDIPASYKENRCFNELSRTTIPQSVRSVIRDRQMQHGNSSFHSVCRDMESLFTWALNRPQTATLVNDHMLFVETQDWDLALCLRNFVSGSGSVFFKGMFYFSSARDQLINAKVDRMIIEDAVWMPTRLVKPANLSSGFDVAKLAAQFPAQLALFPK